MAGAEAVCGGACSAEGSSICRAGEGLSTSTHSGSFLSTSFLLLAFRGGVSRGSLAVLRALLCPDLLGHCVDPDASHGRSTEMSKVAAAVLGTEVVRKSGG